MAETKATVTDRELLAEQAAGQRQLILIALAGPLRWTPQMNCEAETDRCGGLRRPRLERS